MGYYIMPGDIETFLFDNTFEYEILNQFADKEGIALRIPPLQKKELEELIDEAAAKTAFAFEEVSLGQKELTVFLLEVLKN